MQSNIREQQNMKYIRARDNIRYKILFKYEAK